jgi:hypothetical protein
MGNSVGPSDGRTYGSYRTPEADGPLTKFSRSTKFRQEIARKKVNDATDMVIAGWITRFPKSGWFGPLDA